MNAAWQSMARSRLHKLLFCNNLEVNIFIYCVRQQLCCHCQSVHIPSCVYIVTYYMTEINKKQCGCPHGNFEWYSQSCMSSYPCLCQYSLVTREDRLSCMRTSPFLPLFLINFLVVIIIVKNYITYYYTI